ncbi:hypothetical protein CVCC1112_2994 [Paenarthrobacter nicotinovorans]|nr:hypothetical protein CVCC1112_2994 [Paenarthrobacter nicotinovorans]
MHQKRGHREHHQSFRVCFRNYQGCPYAAISPVTTRSEPGHAEPGTSGKIEVCLSLSFAAPAPACRRRSCSTCHGT